MYKNVKATLTPVHFTKQIQSLQLIDDDLIFGHFNTWSFPRKKFICLSTNDIVYVDYFLQNILLFSDYFFSLIFDCPYTNNQSKVLKKQTYKEHSYLAK